MWLTAATAEERDPVPSAGTRARCASAGGLLPLVVEGLCFRADGRTLLQDVSFRLQERATTVVLGPNGAGKSLLLRLCHGLLAPAAGRLTWGGRPPGRVRQRMAMVFQQPVMFRRSVIANLEFALSVHGVGRKERRRRATEALEKAGLQRLARRSARVLSGGERQRLAVARAWALEPEVLLLDEPTANLDPHACFAVEELVRAIRASGTEVVLTTHDLAQARRLGEEVLFLHRGRLLEHAPAAEFFARPRSLEAADFIAGKLLL